jgi:plastocyanin
MRQDDTFSFTFNQAGSFDYFCEIHPGMTGTVTVTE